MRATTRSPVPPRLALALLVLLALSSPAAAQDEKLLVLRGRVLQPDGAPIAGAHIVVTGLRNTRVATDAGGAYQVELRLGSERRLTSDGFELHVRAEKAGHRIQHPGGAPGLDIVYACTGAGSCALTSSDPRVTEALSRCLGPGGPGGAVALVNFIGTRETRIYGYVRTAAGRAVAGCAVSLRLPDGTTIPAATAADGSFAIPVQGPSLAGLVEITAVHAAFDIQPTRRSVRMERKDWTGPVLFGASPRAEAAPVEVAAALGALSRSTAPPATSSSSAAGGVSMPAPPAFGGPSSTALAPITLLSAPLVAPAPNGLGACNCHVDGILELRSATPVDPAPRIEVSLSPDAGVRDTVDFFLGVPRAFHLGGVPCGRYAIHIRNLGSARWSIVNPQGLGEVHCEGESATEIRVLLDRRP